MSSVSLHLYHCLPPAVRCLAVGLRGLYLRSWRYGAETERLVNEAFERERWSHENWKKWQEERLAFVLHRAATRVPFYRDQWASRRRNGDQASWEYLENWPILEKETLRQNPTAFVADDCNIRLMFCEHTSGTTGKPLELWWSRKTVKMWYALFEARGRRWYGVSRHDRWAILGGQLIVCVAHRQPPFWVWNGGLQQLYMSAYHLAPDLMPYYLDALKKYRIKYILGYPSSVHALAQQVLLLKRKNLEMTTVITNAEPLFEYQKQIISEAFQCPVRELYGMAEIVTAASECSAGQLHLWPEVGWVEVCENKLRMDKGSAGDLVCTGLLNIDMPLIRYRVKDIGALGPVGAACSCGRLLPTLASLEGRADDILYTSDGRSIGRLDPVFKTNLPVREAQIIQDSLHRVRVRYVPASGFTTQNGLSIIEQLQARMGSVEVILEQVDVVPRDPNGKFRAVINMMQTASKS